MALLRSTRRHAERDAVRDLRRGCASAVEAHMNRGLPARTWDEYRAAYDAKVRSLCTDEQYVKYLDDNGLSVPVDLLSARSVLGVPYPTYDDFVSSWTCIAQAIAADFGDEPVRNDFEPMHVELGLTSASLGAIR